MNRFGGILGGVVGVGVLMTSGAALATAASLPTPVAHPSIAGRTPSPTYSAMSCTELQETFPYGLGRHDGQDRERESGMLKVEGEADIDFYPDDALYAKLSSVKESNGQRLDDDHDGIMCEQNGTKQGAVNYKVPVSASASTSSPKASSSSNPYTDCATAEKKHLGPIDKTSSWYSTKLDPNGNGIACEANTVWRSGQAYVLTSMVSGYHGASAFTYLERGYVSRSTRVAGPKVDTDYVGTPGVSNESSIAMLSMGVFAAAAGSSVLAKKRRGHRN